MKIHNESIENNEFDGEKLMPEVPTAIQVLRKVVKDEMAAISDYSQFLKMGDFTADDKTIITEILNDEKDHLILLTAMLDDHTSEDYKGYGDSPLSILDDSDDDDDADPIDDIIK